MAGRREFVIPKAPFIVPYRLQRNVIPSQASTGGEALFGCDRYISLTRKCIIAYGNPVGKTQAWVADFSVALFLT